LFNTSLPNTCPCRKLTLGYIGGVVRPELAWAASDRRSGRRAGWVASSVADALKVSGERLPKSWPELCIRNAAAQTRIVSGGWLWPGRRELSRHFKYMACVRTPEFESSHPSHAVRSLRCEFRVFENRCCLGPTADIRSLPHELNSSVLPDEVPNRP